MSGVVYRRGPVYIPPDYERRADLFPEPTQTERASAQARGLRTLTRRAGLSFVGGRWEWDEEVVLERGRPVRVVMRAAVGHLCGYAAIPTDHPWAQHGQVFADVAYAATVHGGVTFGPDEVDWLPSGWWVGFDCGHSGDLHPGGMHEPAGVRECVEVWERAVQDVRRYRFSPTHGIISAPVLGQLPEPWATYRPIEYVRAEIGKLEAAIAAASDVDAEDGSP